MNFETSQHRPPAHGDTTFPGFEPLTANYVYCPNQFLDLCLPNCSRGAVRIVGYLLRETLGWLDRDGQPLKQEITVRYQDLIQKAGVSRGAIAPAIEEAIRSGFILCTQTAAEKTNRNSGKSAVYALRWDRRGEYINRLDCFAGFYSGEGYRTPVPNRFFDNVICKESLSVVKVVGAVIRHTIGYHNQFGGRRSSAPLSYRRIQEYSKLRDRSTLAQAIRHAQQAGYIECLETGKFSPESDQQRTATYAVRWLQTAKSSTNGSKTRPEDRFKNPTSNGSRTRPEDRFKNQTTKKDIKQNDIYKQQTAVDQKALQLLTSAGMDQPTAMVLVQKRGLTVVKNQLEWLDARNPTENRLGMLRKAIDEDWAKPATIVVREKRDEERVRQEERNAQQRTEEAAIAKEKQRRGERKRLLLAEWGTASSEQRRQWIQAAVEHESSAMIRDIIRRDSPSGDNPHVQVLDALAIDRDLPRVVTSVTQARRESSDVEVAAV
ncbi:MAG: hypothetical protein WAO83_19295 [Fuerstiella sp.]